MRTLAPTTFALAALLLLHAACSRGQQASTDANAAAAATTPTPEAAATPEPEREFSGDARALFERGVEAYKNDRDEEAVESLKEAVRLEPDFAQAHFELGRAYRATGHNDEADKAFEDAAKAFEKTTKKDPKNSDAQFYLGLSLSRLGKYDEAVKAFKEAVKHAPEEDDDKYYELAFAHYKIAQYKESIEACKKALEINPDYFQAADLMEKAKPGLERVEAFRKRQEELLKKQQKGTRNANSNSNSNGSTNANSRPAPTPSA
ncbi:MAG TPA: tetratricopeptide repeat protein [Pyrinomonadaceae bacterium]|jgi:tetratricopeptide (TPR) repeat protein|nr:tetratricopeptide repeat protein [Pyrinomonadaceae bacterium]